MVIEYYGSHLTGEKQVLPLTWKQKWKLRIDRLKTWFNWKQDKHVTPKN